MADTRLATSGLPAPDALPGSRLPGPRMPAWIPAPLSRLGGNPLAVRAAGPAIAAAAVAIALLGWLILGDPGRTPLFRQLPDVDKAAIVAALEDAGLDVALDSRTGDVLLPPDQQARARMLLASQGLPRSAPGGNDILESVPLGTSRAIEGARLKSAEERDLASAIETLQGIDAARVLIARPESSPFVREQPPVTASVTLQLAPGRTLSDSQARAILHLVAGAVPGLSPDNVAIADQTGRLLAGEPGMARTAADDRRLRLQAEMEARARQAILAVLGPVVGADNVAAHVAIDLDFSAREAAQERYDREGALRSEQVNRSTSSEPRAMGIPGALTNTIPAAATVAANPPAANAGPAVSSNGSESATRNYELGRSVEVTSRTGGQVRRLTAAVAVRAEALGPPAGRARVLAEIRSLVEGAVGYEAARGDRIAVAARPFADTQVPDVPIWQQPMLVEGLKWLSVGIASAALLAFVVRPVLKRALQTTGNPLPGEAGQSRLPPPPQPPVDYTAKLAEARLLAASDTARATAVARRLLAGPDDAP